jgi:monoamine oxidase
VTNGTPGLCDFFSEVDKILQKMNDGEPDRSFLEFLDECCPVSNSNNDARLREAREWALGYVTGFNAADPALVGVHWLVKGMRAEEKIEGDRAFRAPHGYADLLDIFQQQLDDVRVSVQKNTVVDAIRWHPGEAEISTRSQNGADSFSAPRVLITVPLGVLQARSVESGAIKFDPELPGEKQHAIQNVMMGKVIRVTLRFRDRFWQDLPKSHHKNSRTMDGMSFLFSHDEWFPTWWTMSPEKLPFLTGWAPAQCAERLSGQGKAFVVEQALQALRRLLGVSTQELQGLFEDAYCHDWQNDPFSRGAYSYGKVGGDGLEAVLAEPLSNTLFFAGEATDLGGHNGTVHGAIASGQRAAGEIIRAAESETRRETAGKIRRA